jgi:hypothetical protein
MKSADRPLTPLLRDAKWVLSCGAGTEWVTGGFRPRREAELVELGVLVPIPGRPGHFTVGAVKVTDEQ